MRNDDLVYVQSFATYLIKKNNLTIYVCTVVKFCKFPKLFGNSRATWYQLIDPY